jgi:glucose/arabinose dehydrogenase
MAPAPTARAADPELEPGLVGEYFLFGNELGDFPTIAEGRQPTLVRVDRQVNFPEGGFRSTKFSENFYTRWNGFLKADKAGEYGFATSSDDGSRLFIDDKLVVDNGGLHGMGEKSGKADLSAGLHKIRIEYFQAGGDAGCEVSWTPPGDRPRAIPAAALFHAKGADQVPWDQALWKKMKSGAENPNSPWNKMDYGRFLSATVIAPEPADNVTTKGIAVKLNKEGTAGILFDTVMMRVSAGWSGGFLELKGVAFDGAHGVNPTLGGEQKFGTRPGPGWAGPDGSFNDPRDPKTDPYGPMPKDWFHYKGLYLNGDQVTFSYTVGKTDVLETEGTDGKDEEHMVFTRTFRIGPRDRNMKMRVADFEGATEGRGSATITVSTVGAPPAPKGRQETVSLVKGDQSTVAIVTHLPDAKGAQIKADAQIETDKDAIFLQLPAGGEPVVFRLAIWNGPQKDTDELTKVTQAEWVNPIVDPATLTKAGPPHWTEELTTKGVLGTAPAGKNAGDKAAYVVDTLTVPETNPYNSWLRFAGFDFFPDGHSAALCTWSGDVWVVSGIDDKLDNLKWKRFATGLFQPLGLKIVNGDVYVHGRDQITHLHDTNGDGEADFYENFNNDETVSPAFHEFAFDLQTDAAGNFYVIKGGGVNPGGRGFMRPITANQGTVSRISKDGSKLEVIATGFRAPNGMCVRADGQIITGDNQGSWTPVDRLNWVKPGGFYGVPELSHRDPEPTVTDNPLCWLVYPSWDNSCGDPVWVTSDKFGPFKDELLYSSYGKCALFKVLKEEAGGEMQGGVVKFPLQFQSSVMRLRFNDGPNGDGQLYLCGLKGWQTDASRDTAFQRVRYTGKPVYLPTDLHVKENGVEITFLQKLDAQSAADTGNFGVEQWNYKWTSDYGSPEVKASNGQPGHDVLTIKSAKLLADGKTVFLEIPGIQPVMQMLIKYNIDAADGAEVKGEIANTINYVPPDRHLKVEVGKVEEVTK